MHHPTVRRPVRLSEDMAVLTRARQRAAVRLTARATLIAAISLALILSPWVPALLPAPLDELSSSPVAAQVEPPITLTVNDSRATCPVDPAVTPTTADDHLHVFCLTPNICPSEPDESPEDDTESLQPVDVSHVNVVCIEPANCNNQNNNLLRELDYLEIDGDDNETVPSTLGNHLHVFCVPPDGHACPGDAGDNPPSISGNTVTVESTFEGETNSHSLHVVCVPPDICTRLPSEAADNGHLRIYCVAFDPCHMEQIEIPDSEETLPLEEEPPRVFCGTRSPCPTDPLDDRPWAIDENDPSVCTLIQPACPKSPLQLAEDDDTEEPERYTQYSNEFHDLCEDTIFESESQEVFDACADNSDEAELTGFAFKIITVGGEQGCRVILPTRCASGMHRVGSNECRQYQRRTWQCPEGSIQRNEFNTCAQLLQEYIDTNHAACQTGAPQFVVSTCVDYVGNDVVTAPNAIDCATYDTGSIFYEMTTSVNNYWCSYDRSWLDISCHASAASCTVEIALCIKRISSTGGCDAVADTIRCRILQAAFLDAMSGLSLDDVYQEGCSPCTILPFVPMPAECPTQHSASPIIPTLNRLVITHLVKDDFVFGNPDCAPLQSGGNLADHPDCERHTPCADPPSGQIEWETAHSSGLVVVNSPVIINIVDTPRPNGRYRYFRYLSGTLYVSSVPHFEYPNEPIGVDGTLLRSWPEIDAGSKPSSVDRLLQKPECYAQGNPSYRLIVEELWPDDDAGEILDLFGPNALDWWNSLAPANQQALSEARGITLLSGLTPAEQDQERLRRESALRQESDCNYGSELWCRWTPQRTGYFRLTVAGAWHMARFNRGRAWKSPHQRNLLRDFLQNDVSAPDNDCTTNDRWTRGKDHDCILEDLEGMGMTSPSEIGLLNDLSDLVPGNFGNREYPFTTGAGNNFRCPPRDLRVSCGGTGESVNYTLTAPLGIMVHEARVVTRTPS